MSGFGDVSRFVNMALALALVVAGAYAVVLSKTPDQRLRFVTLTGFGALITSTGVGALGNPWRWEISALTILVALGLAGTLIFVRRELRARRGER